MPDRMDDTSRAIGNLEGALRAQGEDIRKLTTAIEQRDTQAGEGRRRLYNSFESFKDSVSKRLTLLELQSEQHTNSLSLITPTVQEWQEMKAQTAGAAKLGRVIYVVLSAIAAGLAATAWHLIELFNRR